MTEPIGAMGGTSMHPDLEKSVSKPPTLPPDLLASEADAELLGKLPTLKVFIRRLVQLTKYSQAGIQARAPSQLYHD